MHRDLAEPSNQALADELGSGIVNKELLGGGGNSRLYKIETADGERFAVKQYLADRPERDPLTCEFASLEFLWGSGVRCVPRPVCMLPRQRIAIFEFIEGQRLAEEELSPSELDQFRDFVVVLRRLHKAPGVEDISLASEACFAPSDLFAAIDRRLMRLRQVEDPELQDYLGSEFSRVYDQIRQSENSSNQDHRLAVGRVLSPSDFGVHNAIRRSNNAVAFVDFEYFGWDDPAKMISDFLLHPANQRISRSGIRRLATGMIDVFDDQPELSARIHHFYPLCGLNWCLILLNEFLMDELTRRLHARGGGQVDVVALRKNQLRKSIARLAQVESHPLGCPYLPPVTRSCLPDDTPLPP